MKFINLSFAIPPNGQLLNKQITFPFNGLCKISINSSEPFLYELYSVIGTHYSDKPILCEGKKELLSFGSYKGRVFSFDFKNVSGNENIITLNAEFEDKPFNDKYYSFREYTLDGLYRKTPIEIKAGEGAEVSLTNFRGGHYEIHKVYSAINKRLSCKIKYHNRIIERFPLEDEHSFKKPWWILNWPDSAMLYIKSQSDLAIQPNEIYFAGYLIKPTEVIKKVVPIDARYSSLLEGIKLR
jgi:hypothetical protein